jgi:BirA family biotin operon repressor/biotin-[acetyl-CoA-carboxylase] ligase
MKLRERLDHLMEELAKHVENLVLFEVTDSTHALARRIIAEMDEESQKLGATLILADRQEKGEGRGDRGWESPAGGLYMSWLRSGIKAETITQLPMLAAAAAWDAITRIGVSDVRIRWPNDILVEEHKLAGILVFARHGDTTWVTVGLGVNLETAPVIDEAAGLPATSIADLLGSGDMKIWRHELVCTFIDQLDRLMEDPAPAIDRWRNLLIQRPGDAVSVRLASGQVVSGTLLELTEEGFLKIRENGKERVVTGGDVIES